ncbi:hypothetical protein QCA50_019580 [Cerrena zonata]|uniref:Uncharacterized protein n=1 Tax=Cerrena zonata TaxID=2478898 RepID=A0AAW0FC14_9APHY
MIYGVVKYITSKISTREYECTCTSMQSMYPYLIAPCPGPFPPLRLFHSSPTSVGSHYITAEFRSTPRVCL